MKPISTFIERLKKIGVSVELAGNFPWIYLLKVNGNRVSERFLGNHGFTIAFYPIKKDQQLKFTDLSEIFKIIRKYR